MTIVIVKGYSKRREGLAANIKQTMIERTAVLLAKKGLQGASFSEILEASGAPRGSLYHHFPEGKDQLVAAAVDLAGSVLIDFMDRCAGQSAEDVVLHFLTLWRAVLMRSECESGCAVLAVTVATDSNELLAHATAVFRAWRERLAELLKQGGLPAESARRFAMVMIASVEGAVVLSRADQSLEAFEVVAEQLVGEVGRLRGEAG